MNILYFHPHFSYPGGAGKFVLETGERLAKMGHNVIVLTQSGDQEILKNYPNIKFKFIGGPLPNMISHWILFPLLMQRIFKVTKKMDIDIIFPQVFPASYWGFLYKMKYPNIPCLWYCHDLGSFIYQKDLVKGLKNPVKIFAIATNPLFRLIDRHLIKKVDLVVTNSNFTSKFIHNTYNLTSKVIYPGVDISKFKPTSAKENMVFSANRLYKFKKIDLLIKAMAKVKGAHLYVAGDGDERNNLSTLSEELGISNKVTFLGNLNDKQLSYYYSKAKVAVFPAENEAFGIAQIESMASGTPVVTVYSGGVIETVIDGKTGFLVNPDDIYGIAMKIERLISDSELCSTMSINSRKHVENNFTWDITVEKLNRLFVNEKYR